jgi:hypothetical protein
MACETSPLGRSRGTVGGVPLSTTPPGEAERKVLLKKTWTNKKLQVLTNDALLLDALVERTIGRGRKEVVRERGIRNNIC